jgi:molecular chaperone GrpE
MKFKFSPFNKNKMNQEKEPQEIKDEKDELSNESPQEVQVNVEEELSETDKLKIELAETRDKFLRTYSEFENYKKRTQRERIELFKTANSEVILAVLPILDDFERALKSIETAGSMNSVKEGIELIYNKLKSVLENKGLKKMNSIGEEFNVDHHEAITNVPAAEESQKGKVIDEAESGYFLNDKVIRHAKVIVGN